MLGKCTELEHDSFIKRVILHSHRPRVPQKTFTLVGIGQVRVVVAQSRGAACRAKIRLADKLDAVNIVVLWVIIFVPGVA